VKCRGPDAANGVFDRYAGVEHDTETNL